MNLPPINDDTHSESLRLHIDNDIRASASIRESRLALPCLLGELSHRLDKKPLGKLNTSALQSRRKKRGGWWDKSNDIQADMEEIKCMLRSSDSKEAYSREFDLAETSRKNAEKELTDITRKMVQNVALLEDITESGHIKKSTEITRHVGTGSKHSVSTASIDNRAVDNVAPAAEESIKVISSNVTPKRKPWNFEAHPEQIETKSLERLNPILESTINDERYPTPAKFCSDIFGKQLKCIIVILPYKDSTNEEATISILDVHEYLLSIHMEQTATILAKEANIPGKSLNYLTLHNYIQQHDFGRAVVFVQNILSGLSAEGSAIKLAFEDLIYVLSKYLLISLHQLGRNHIAIQTLKMVILPMIQKVISCGGSRANWFENDYNLLEDLLSDSIDSDKNIYQHLNWNAEIAKFWGSADIEYSRTDDPPLFAHALTKYFKSSSAKGLLPKKYSEAKKFEQMRDLLYITTKNKSAPIRALPLAPQLVALSPTKNTPMTNIPIEVDYESVARQNKSKVGSIASTDRSRASIKFGQGQLPPMNHNPESSNFALSKLCGPSNGLIRVMDVNVIADSGRIVAITASGDKEITVWDVKQNSVISTLGSVTAKPKAIVAIMFHPSFPELFITADMDFDVKLWNWKDSSLVRWWKKHHSRIIFQIGFIPGDDSRSELLIRAISCSGDQSLKIWNIHADKTTHRGSVHANEPITSFTFCGSPTDPLQQKLIISLSYTIRIYKLRTLTLLHSISLNDLKITCY